MIRRMEACDKGPVLGFNRAGNDRVVTAKHFD